jgi:hypothetical protein
MKTFLIVTFTVFIIPFSLFSCYSTLNSIKGGFPVPDAGDTEYSPQT